MSSRVPGLLMLLVGLTCTGPVVSSQPAAPPAKRPPAKRPPPKRPPAKRPPAKRAPPKRPPVRKAPVERPRDPEPLRPRPAVPSKPREPNLAVPLRLGFGPAVPTMAFWLDPLFLPGPTLRFVTSGLPVMQSVFHLGLGVEAGWDSNVFYAAQEEGPDPSAYLRLRPRLTVGSRPIRPGEKPLIAVQVRSGLDYRAYLQDLPGTGHSRRHPVGAEIHSDLVLNPMGSVSLGILQRFVRHRSRTMGAEAWFGTGQADRLHAQAGLELKIAPGRTRHQAARFRLHIGYLGMVDLFEDTALRFGNRTLHLGRILASYSFQRVQLWVSLAAGYHWLTDSYFDFDLIGLLNQGQPRSVPLRARAGITLRLKGLTARADLGYGAILWDDSSDRVGLENHHDVLARITGRFLLSGGVALSLGYRHDFRLHWAPAFVVSDSAFIQLEIMRWKRLLLRVLGAWTLWRFKGYWLLDVGGDDCIDIGGYVAECRRSDHTVLVGVTLGYAFLRWLSAGVGYEFQGNFGGLDAMDVSTGVPFRFGFARHRVFGRLTASY